MPNATPELPLDFDADPRRSAGKISAPPPTRLLTVFLDHHQGEIRLQYEPLPGIADPKAVATIRCTGLDALSWTIVESGKVIFESETRHHRLSIRSQLKRLRAAYIIEPAAAKILIVEPRSKRINNATTSPPAQFWRVVENEIARLAFEMKVQFAPIARTMGAVNDSEIAARLAELSRMIGRKDKKEDERAERVRKAKERQRLHEREQQKARARRDRDRAKAKEAAAEQKSRQLQETAPPHPQAPTPVLRVESPALEWQPAMLPLTSLDQYRLIEEAAAWWISNQSDDLLCLPYCHVEHLDYQIRTALRVIGPLRGRALLSDEVGLGKTIEAGLIIKEYLSRGMIRNYLVLTVPSLVDQWEAELSEKFDLNAATTNRTLARQDPSSFWNGDGGVIASLHTFKKSPHRELAQAVHWDMVVVDEAHYLRNRTSLAWQAIGGLQQQFLLLLTATPVQNSLEELYNLVTLLKPGQLPSPKQFRDRFIDRHRPHEPREPEELRRLLGQVMIRNTRANANIELPPRRAETVIFEASPEERTFWNEWERELRAQLDALPAGQASLWGRLLLQAAGSSPAAWQKLLESFPNRTISADWVARVARSGRDSWNEKCRLVAPLCRGEGGLVLFTQFLQTQAALAERFLAEGIPAWVINGQTPAPQRHPITEEFRRQGGVLLLTHSGTEGRNLQFSHQLVNFDLPWNPMEIEQRIGRLHRFGQKHPVRIYNIVQAGTLQEHLLAVLQDKLNLFELVVGETGLILGERFGSDEFAEEVFRRWREAEGGDVHSAIRGLGDDLAAARDGYRQVKELDETLFAADYESL